MKVITKHEYCVDSPDFINPIGATNDDTTNLEYIEDIEKYFGNKKLTTLELGCAGGRIVMDLIERGHNSYGLEGTPHPREKKRPAWEKYYQTNMFNCDLGKPFTLLDNKGKLMQFDLISHWEFLEHMPTESLDLLMANLHRHLKPDGKILCAVSPWGPTTDRKHDPDGKIFSHPCNIAGVAHHQSCFMQEEWNEKYFNRFFNVHEYPFAGKLRHDWSTELNIGSFETMLSKKEGIEDYVNEIIKINEPKDE